MPHERRLPIVWHDLMTREVAPAMHLYAALLGWTYRVEHAAVCAWTGQEADYPLILAHSRERSTRSSCDCAARLKSTLDTRSTF
jgi:hypothetical protein